MTTIAVTKHFDVFEQVRDGFAMRAVPRAMHALVFQAVEEAFFSALEAKLRSREHFATHEQARQRIFWFLEGWYNVRRLHSSMAIVHRLNSKTSTLKGKPYRLAGCLPAGSVMDMSFRKKPC